MGVLTATGLIVGDSLFQVLYAGVVAWRGDPDVLAILPPYALAVPLGLALFGGLIALTYQRLWNTVRS